jgi:hypothetical protein
MAYTRKPAKEAVSKRDNGALWIDHAVITESDFSWLQDVTALTLWNVTLPPKFLARLPHLRGLDWRGGSATNLEILEGAHNLGYLVVNQVRGMVDLSLLPSLSSLKLLSLYGLPKLNSLPSLQLLNKLLRIQIGQVKFLQSIGPALEAPHLQELLLSKFVGVTQKDIDSIRNHKHLANFSWDILDTPRRVYESTMQQIHLPLAKSEFPDKWYTANA